MDGLVLHVSLVGQLNPNFSMIINCNDVTICVFRIAGDETKVQVDSTNTEGYTALHYACWQGHQKVAKLLKEAGADPRARYRK